jgi:hypothetical protein
MDELAADHGPCPAALIAATRKRTDVPLFSPVAVQVSTAPRPVHPGCEVKAPPNRDRCTAYPVMADPPLDGAVQVSIEFVSPAVALGAFGAPGTPEGVAAADDPDAAPVPAAFTAATRKKYATPLVSPPAVQFNAVLAAVVAGAQVPLASVKVPVALVEKVTR